MTMLATAQRVPVRTVDEVQALETILEAETEALICSRTYASHARRWLEGLSENQLPQGQFVLHPDDVSACLLLMFETAVPGVSPARDWFVKDIAALASAVSRISAARLLRLCVETVTEDASDKFQVEDSVVRLICTYRGPGTEFAVIPPDARSRYIESVPTGMPALFKGARWPSDTPLNVEHRQPRIEQSGKLRYVVTLEGVWANGQALASLGQTFGAASRLSIGMAG